MISTLLILSFFFFSSCYVKMFQGGERRAVVALNQAEILTHWAIFYPHKLWLQALKPRPGQQSSTLTDSSLEACRHVSQEACDFFS